MPFRHSLLDMTGLTHEELMVLWQLGESEERIEGGELALGSDGFLPDGRAALWLPARA
ncbi:MAG: hypothetical protein R3F19_27885 [Verrucomicrobiales bacterium]